MLEMSAEMHTAMVDHAIAGLPHEACGLFAGQPGSNRIERFFPMRNAAESREIYVLDGLEMMDVERTADDAGLAVMGVMHSHTHTTNYPSPTDIADAARFDPFGAWRFVIVSLRHAEPSLRSFRILDGQVTEEPVAIDGRAGRLRSAWCSLRSRATRAFRGLAGWVPSRRPTGR